MIKKSEKTISRKPVQETENTDLRAFALEKRNLLFIAIAFVAIILGFALMAGEGSTPEHFNPDIFSFRRIVVAPFITFAGYVFMVFAILYKPKKEDSNTDRE